MNPRINVGKGVTGAVRYVLGRGPRPEDRRAERPGAETARAASTGSAGTGFGFDDRDRGRCRPGAADDGIRRAQPDQPHAAMRAGLRASLACLAAGRDSRPASRWKRRRASALERARHGERQGALRRPQRRGLCARSHRRLEDQSRHRPRLRPRRQLAQALDLGRALRARAWRRRLRAPAKIANELRAAIRTATPAPCSRR